MDEIFSAIAQALIAYGLPGIIILLLVIAVIVMFLDNRSLRTQLIETVTTLSEKRVEDQKVLMPAVLGNIESNKALNVTLGAVLTGFEALKTILTTTTRRAR